MLLLVLVARRKKLKSFWPSSLASDRLSSQADRQAQDWQTEGGFEIGKRATRSCDEEEKLFLERGQVDSRRPARGQPVGKMPLLLNDAEIKFKRNIEQDYEFKDILGT